MLNAKIIENVFLLDQISFIREYNRKKGLLSLNTLIKVKWGSSVLRLERIKSDDLVPVHLINKEA